MLSAAFKQAETPDGLKRLVQSARTLRALGGSADHLCEAIAYGSIRQGLSVGDFADLLMSEAGK